MSDKRGIRVRKRGIERVTEQKRPLESTVKRSLLPHVGLIDARPLANQPLYHLNFALDNTAEVYIMQNTMVIV